MTPKLQSHLCSGQVLTSLLIIMLIGTMITTAASALVSTSSLSTGGLQESNQALTVAESGVEDNLIKLLRNPLSIGETLTVNGGQAVVTITSGSPTVIVSQGTVGNHVRTVRVVVSFNSGLMVVESWKEI